MYSFGVLVCASLALLSGSESIRKTTLVPTFQMCVRRREPERIVGFIADLESRSMCALFGAMSYFWPSFEPPFEVLLRSVRSKSRMVAVQYEVHYFWSPSSYTCGFPTFDCILVMMVWPVDGKYHI